MRPLDGDDIAAIAIVVFAVLCVLAIIVLAA